MDEFLEIRDLSKNFGSTKALDKVNFKIGLGEITGIFGENLSGKSTLLKCLAGLMNFDGQIDFKSKKKGPVAYLGEDLNFFENFTLSQAFDFYADFYEDFNNEEASNLAEIFFLDKEKKLADLGESEKSKFKLCINLSRDAALYILDDPLKGLDYRSRANFTSLLLKKFDGKRTFVIASPYPDQFLNLLDRFAILQKGRIVYEGEAEKIRENEGCDLDDFYRKFILNV